jgi:RNA polymerase sigma factor (sigma-70 family)
MPGVDDVKVLRNNETGSDAPANRDEVALVGRVACGAVAAFDSLFRRYAPRVVRFLERRMRAREVIDEIVNDTMLVVWRKAGTFNRASRVSTWILGIASRRRLKALERSNDRVSAVDVAEIEIATESGPEARLVADDARRRLIAAIDALPDEQRSVVVLTYFEGRTYPEIARIVGCPVNTVKTRMFHARRRLKTLLAEERSVA